jgi:hypothetical protein
MDWRQVWNEELDTHRRKLPGSPADQTNININEENNLYQMSMKKNKTRCVMYVMIGMIGFNKYLGVIFR